ncbi:MAG: cytochrome c oxidase subunit 3 [Kofleriaceae bacterium]
MSEPSHDHHDDHGHHGSRFIQHHYDDAAHQFDSGKLGIWFFLVQEILFFSALFVAYIVFRAHHPEIFAYAHHYLDVKWGAINTAVLIVSSLTAAWAVRCAQLNQRKGLIACLSITILCALGFLGIKTIEYTHKIHEHILWGKYFDPCVASAGNHLLNKGNNCPGFRSSVTWDAKSNKAASGCLEGEFDREPEVPGIQAECKVTEVKGANRRPVEACAEEGGKSTFPCWELSANPHVCPAGPGALIIYGDHAHHGDVTVEATCEAVPATAPVGDAFAPAAKPEVEGQATFRRNPALTKHERQHLFASGPPPEHTSMFFSIYFAMTGLHGIHVLVGVFIFIWLLVRAIRGDFTPEYFGPIDYAALYWHLVDLIWIFLFPLLYLIH